MSALSNAARLRRTYDAFERRDLPAFLEFCSPDVEIESEIGSYPAGHAGVRGWWEDMTDAFAVGIPETDLLVELDGVTVSLMGATWRGHASGVEFEAKRVHAARWEDGRMVWWTFAITMEDALRRAGLDVAQTQAWSHVAGLLDLAAAMERQDVEGALSAYHAETEVRPLVRALAEGVDVVRGHDELRAWLTSSWETFDEFRIVPLEVRSSGDRALCLARLIARGDPTGADVDRVVAFVMRWRDEGIVEQDAFLDPDDAFAAAGLSP